MRRRRRHRDRPPERTGFRGMGEIANFERQRRKKKFRSWLVFVPVWIGAAIVGTAYGAGWLTSPTKAGAEVLTAPPGIRANFSLCHVGGGYNCVVDGDTLWLQGTKIRIADIDAPETHDPRCPTEKALGDRTTRRLQELLNSGAVTLDSIDRDQDGYGRKLRLVRVDGQNVGDTLVSEGLARWYAGGRRPWC